jgi:hypothetical protein
MGTPVKQELGNTYGLLTVTRFYGQAKGGHALWECTCACGSKTVTYGSNLRNGHTTSCGCYLLKRVTRHGAARRTGHTPEYDAFQTAKQRCTNPNDAGFKNYGGRGIKLLFASFEQWYAELGPRPSPQHSVDRFPNNDGNYESGNVRWATKIEQASNQRRRLRLDQWSPEELLDECQKRGLL